jgi:tetratricopeptide (TPR) repeat protein
LAIEKVDKSKVLLALIGILAGFILGFLFANSQNRKEIDNLQNEIQRLKNSSTGQTDSTNQHTAELTLEEIRGAIAKADQNPNDIELQRNVGVSLYKYAMSQRDTRYLNDIARLLKRVANVSDKDYDLTVMLGNLFFDIAQKDEDPKLFLEARQWYQKALAMKPDDVNVRTDLGLTYFFANPPDVEKAIAEYRKSLAVNPKHELTLQNLIQALIFVKKFDEAQKRIEELRSVNSSNAALPELEKQLAQAKK